MACLLSKQKGVLHLNQYTRKQKYFIFATISCLLCVFPNIALAQESQTSQLSQAEKYIQKNIETENYLQQLYAPHAETLSNILEDATNDLLPKEEVLIEEPKEETPKYIIDFTQEEIDLLAKVVYAEAGNQPFEGQVAVAATIINRVQSSRFPNTLKEVIYAKNQFSVVKNGVINKSPNTTSYQAVIAAMQGQDPSNEALYFWNPKIAKNNRYFNSLTKTAEIGNHAFAK